jgi:hypothetical protein
MNSEKNLTARGRVEKITPEIVERAAALVIQLFNGNPQIKAVVIVEGDPDSKVLHSAGLGAHQFSFVHNLFQFGLSSPDLVNESDGRLGCYQVRQLVEQVNKRLSLDLAEISGPDGHRLRDTVKLIGVADRDIDVKYLPCQDHLPPAAHRPVPQIAITPLNDIESTAIADVAEPLMTRLGSELVEVLGPSTLVNRLLDRVLVPLFCVRVAMQRSQFPGSRISIDRMLMRAEWKQLLQETGECRIECILDLFSNHLEHSQSVLLPAVRTDAIDYLGLIAQCRHDPWHFVHGHDLAKCVGLLSTAPEILQRLRSSAEWQSSNDSSLLKSAIEDIEYYVLKLLMTQLSSQGDLLCSTTNSHLGKLMVRIDKSLGFAE